MKCSYCNKDYDEDKTGVSMYAAGVLIGNYCSRNCRTKASQRMIHLLENKCRKPPRKRSRRAGNG
jgi:hypothetical protein